MKSFNFKSATNTKEATKLATGKAAFLAGGMTLLPAIKLRLAAYSDLININVKGVFNTIKEFLPEMINMGSGAVVNLSSGWGRSTSPEVAPYCSSKWAVEGLSKALAQELPEGMASVALNPGVIDTDMLRSCWNDSAGMHETPDIWAKRASPFILNINPEDNGASLTVS